MHSFMHVNGATMERAADLMIGRRNVDGSRGQSQLQVKMEVRNAISRNGRVAQFFPNPSEADYCSSPSPSNRSDMIFVALSQA